MAEATVADNQALTLQGGECSLQDAGAGQQVVGALGTDLGPLSALGGLGGKQSVNPPAQVGPGEAHSVNPIPIPGQQPQVHRGQGGGGPGHGHDASGVACRFQRSGVVRHEGPQLGEVAWIVATRGLAEEALGQPHGAQFQAVAEHDALPLAQYHLRAPAAQVDDRDATGRQGQSVQGAQPRQPCLLDALDDADLQAGLLRDPSKEGGAVQSPAGGTGRHGPDGRGRHAQGAGGGDVVAQHLDGRIHPVGPEQTPVTQALAQTDHRRLVVQGGAVRPAHQQEQRVAADVDGGTGRRVHLPPLER